MHDMPNWDKFLEEVRERYSVANDKEQEKARIPPKHITRTQMGVSEEVTGGGKNE